MSFALHVSGLFDPANLPSTTGMKFGFSGLSGSRQVVTFLNPVTDVEVEYAGSFAFAADGKTIIAGQLDQLVIRVSGETKTYLLTTLALDVAPMLTQVNSGDASAILLNANGPSWHVHASANESDIRGASGADVFYASGSQNTFDGRAGIDTASFAEKLSPYSYPVGDMPALKIAAPGHATVVTVGENAFVNIERFEFANTNVAVDIDGNAGRAYRLYQAAFDRKPDLEGMGYQMNALDSGLTLQQVAAHFIASPEFQQTYGALGDTAFVTQLYRNVLDREPEDAGLAYHLHDMQANGKTRAMILANFSESPENQANVIGSIQDGIVYA